AGPLPVVRADRAKLTRAIRDVFDAAVRWRGDEGIPWVHVAARDHGSQWEIEITDNGRGFTDDEAESLFGPLARFSSPDAVEASTKLGTIGVGLAAVRRIAELHGGSAAVSSAPGKGTTYSLFIGK